MEFPGDDISYRSGEDFDTAEPSEPGDFGAELLAQVRNNGRILDHHRIVLGGSKLQTILVPLTKMMQLPSLSGWRFKFQFWPRDVTIRRNMSTSIWVDVSSIIAEREATIIDDSDNQVPRDAVLGEMEKEGAVAAVRWAVVVGEDSLMRLHLQSLPASADYLTGKPAFRG